MVLMAEYQSLRDFLDEGGVLAGVPRIAMIAEVAIVDRAVMDPDDLRRQAEQDRWAGTEMLAGRPVAPTVYKPTAEEDVDRARMYLWSAEVALDAALAARFVAGLPSDVRATAEADRDGRLVALAHSLDCHE